MKKFLQFCFLLIILVSCDPDSRKGVDEEKFASHWYQGKAEINVFDLKQMRYGESRQGKAVMIFVTEDFSKRRQVKLDDPSGAGADAQKVLKLNMTREFVTGVYPYHTMLSVFTPVYEELKSPKLVVSVTEWCGQSFIQLNWKNNAYQAQIFSYFEAEGDQSLQVKAQPEDELFNLIRLNPDLIRTGERQLIPSLIYQRFSHIPLQGEDAVISKRKFGSAQAEVEVFYPDLGRTLIIRYLNSFPFEIISWEETQLKEDGAKEITSAVRSKVSMLDYWNKNTKADEGLRENLGF
ncbi:MAG: hypothetical protein ACI9UV_000043 [Algoriphagus sp.]|jgi:hypothetical protein